MKFHHLSIKWQFAMLIIMVALPFIILSFYNLRSEKSKEIDQARNLSINAARYIGIQQKYTETSTKQLLSLISKLPELQIQHPDSLVLNKILQNVLEENPQYAILLAALPNGEAFASAYPFKPFSISDRKYYQDILKNRMFTVGEFAISRITNKPVIHYALPVYDKNENLKLILIASYDVTQFQKVIMGSNLDPESDFAFYDYSGRVLYHSSNPKFNQGTRGNPEIQEAIRNHEDEGAYFIEDENGESRLCGYLHVSLQNKTPYMYIVVGTPISTALETANRNFYFNLMLIFLAIAISTLISFYYKNFIFRDFDKLVTVSEKLKAGELSVRTGIDYSSGETGSLAHALDNMAISLQKKEAERDTALSNLRTLSERFELAAKSARIGIWEWNLITQRVFWDKQMYELYNLQEEDFKNTIPAWMKCLHLDDAARFEEELHQSIRTKNRHKTSFRIKNKDQGYKNIRCFSNTMTDKNGKPSRIVGVNWDITERILLENELIKAKATAEHKIFAVKEMLENHAGIIRHHAKIIQKEMEALQKSVLTDELSMKLKVITDPLEEILKEMEFFSNPIP